MLALLEASSRHFEAGQRELEIGHLEQAKTEFNRSLEVLLESPYGARSEPRIREHFDRLVDRISAYELTALTEGDGFKEKPSEPATIDQLLALSLFDKPEPTPELTDTVKSDLENTSHDVPIPLNPRVLSYIELFQGRLRSFITEGLVRGSKYLPMIQNVFRAEGLPLDLAYVPLVESAFKPNALSRASAKGVWQFMRGTALENGLRHDWYVDERSDPEKSTLAAAKYLKTLSGMFDGDWHLALASYNGGPGRVQRAMKRSGRQEFWSLAAVGPVPAARDPRVRADDSRRDRHRQEPGPVRIRHPARARRSEREGHLAGPRRSSPNRRVDRQLHRHDPGAQPGTAALDDTGSIGRVHVERSRGHCRAGDVSPRMGAAGRTGGAQLVHRPTRRVTCRPSRESCASAAESWRPPTICPCERLFGPGSSSSSRAPRRR